MLLPATQDLGVTPNPRALPHLASTEYTIGSDVYISAYRT